MPRKICYITGTRADFGLMKSTLHLLNNDPNLELGIVVTGMHLDPACGMTVNEIEEAQLPIEARIKLEKMTTSGEAMALHIGTMLRGFTAHLSTNRPDIVLLLGDRGEMLAGALAAIHLNIPVAHIHGGERSGTVDESVRHAISKLSHIHFAATEQSKQRLIKMGEQETSIFVSGAPGLDGLDEIELPSLQQLAEKYNLDAQRSIAILLFHPVLQEADEAKAQTEIILKALQTSNHQILALMPNSDSGGQYVRQALQDYTEKCSLRLATHLPRLEFLSFLKNGDLLIGNSSAGIIESACFGIPVINVGSRQNLRERNANVTDLPIDQQRLEQALQDLKGMRFPCQNIYGNGTAGQAILSKLKSVDLTPNLLNKVIAY
ncbi:UDP-N-acetylglucosamine 2-epimerase [Cohaesibacter celericrescens]|uniref:UDP-N-acetylglucosamine 2-epimerase (Hydrolyzing) n=1 Tax=Cohaesibacter celericrescens TaxID=2067669 RepID=A0A2N5XUN1_9HYPH|nr:UDP-N-acetylglucosamine 2-epimerase [Cohaesibacter celericrescens]PLW78204.1 UDP-N-acetylglucosamine 2-epimerase (hydrolyzing) [Cohaesibacter celericrescens]